MTRAVACVFVLAAAVSGFAPSADAQLGETTAEIARRFGTPVRHNARVRDHQVIGSPTTAGDVHMKGGCFVRVVYSREISVQAEYSPLEGGLTREQVDAILTNAGDGSQWKPMPNSDARILFFRRLDGQALASWTVGPNGSLLIAADDSGALGKNLLLDAR